MSNRINSQGVAPLTPVGRSSQFIRNVVPAGQSVPFPAAGTSFYVTQASSPLLIKPSGGSFNRYDVGTGLEMANVNAFSTLEVKNDTAGAIAFEIFVGFDGFIDNRVIIAQSLQTMVAFPTYKTASSAAVVNITDLTGTKFQDINGNYWYAIGREAIYVFNPDAGVTLLLQLATATTASGFAVGVIYPQTSLRYGCAGNYRLSVGGGNINAIVSEIYYAIPTTANG